jgi:hypothetical protein
MVYVQRFGFVAAFLAFESGLTHQFKPLPLPPWVFEHFAVFCVTHATSPQKEAP